jgi:hypothetical protein
MQETLFEHGLVNRSLYRNEKASAVRAEFKNTWKDCFKFAFVRNPIDRYKSSIATVKHLKGDDYDMDYLLRYNPTIFRRQVDTLDEELDFIGKYENIKRDWNKVCKIIGEKIELPLVNKTENKRELTKNSIKLVREFYAEDFKRYGYK